MINTYKRTNWIDEDLRDLSIGTPISAKNMNNMEEGIYNLDINVYKLLDDIETFVKLYGDDTLINKMTLKEVYQYVINKIKIVEEYLDSLVTDQNGNHIYIESTLKGKTKKLSVKGTIIKNYLKSLYDTTKDYFEYTIEMTNNKFIARYLTHGLKLYNTYTLIFTMILPANLLNKGKLKIIDNDSSYYVCEESDPIIPNTTCLLVKKKFVPLSINTGSVTSYLKSSLEFDRVDLDITDYKSKIILTKPVILEGDMTQQDIPCYFNDLYYPAKDLNLNLISKNHNFEDCYDKYILNDNNRYYIDFELDNEDNITFYNGSNRTVYLEEYHKKSNTLARTFKIGAKKSHYFRMSGYELNKTRIVAYRDDNWNSENKEELMYCMFLSGEVNNNEVSYLDMEKISNNYSFKLPYTLKAINNEIYDSCYVDETSSTYKFKSVVRSYEFKGAEAWGLGPSTNDMTIIFKLNAASILPDIKIPANNDEIPSLISNNLPVYSYNELIKIKNLSGISIDSNGILYARVLKRVMTKTNVDGFKSYLKTNVITVLFERKIAIIKDYNGDLNVDTYDGGTYITSKFPGQPILSIDSRESFANNIYNVIVKLQKIATKIDALSSEVASLKEIDLDISSEMGEILDSYNKVIKKVGE